MDPDQELRSLKRGLRVLELLNQFETIGVSELARKLDLPRTTAERILVTLASEGYVHRLPNDRRYRLTAKVCDLGRGYADDSWIIHVATPLLFAMTKRIGWPLGIATPSGEHTVLRLTTDPATSLWLHRRRIGVKTPRLGGGAGLVSFAFEPPAEKEQLLGILKNSIYPINRERASDEALLNSLIQPILVDGYAFQPPPSDSPERSISVPIWIDGAFGAALFMVYMPRALKNAAVLRDYLPIVRALADKIGERVSQREDWDENEQIGEDIDLPASVSAFGADFRR